MKYHSESERWFMPIIIANGEEGSQAGSKWILGVMERRTHRDSLTIITQPQICHFQKMKEKAFWSVSIPSTEMT